MRVFAGRGSVEIGHEEKGYFGCIAEDAMSARLDSLGVLDLTTLRG